MYICNVIKTKDMNKVIKDLKKLVKSIKDDNDLLTQAKVLLSIYSYKQLKVLWNNLYDTNLKDELNLVSTAILMAEKFIPVDIQQKENKWTMEDIKAYERKIYR